MDKKIGGGRMKLLMALLGLGTIGALLWFHRIDLLSMFMWGIALSAPFEDSSQ